MEWMRRSRWVYLAKKLTRIQRVSIELYGNEQAKDLFRAFSAPHPRYFIIPKKVLGVALVSLAGEFADYLREKGQLKRKRNRAVRLGYKALPCDPAEHLDDIMAVNSSLDARQGRAIDPEYLDRERVEKYFAGKSLVFGAFLNGRLYGYIDVLIYGDVCILGRIMGHADHLENGVMYLLVSEVAQTMMSRRKERGSPRWMMYDTMFGASDGLRFFKEQCGFEPFLVKWRWKEAV